MNIGNKDVWIERIEVAPIFTNCYIVTDLASKATMVVDPGGSYPRVKKILDEILAETDSEVKLLVNTHGHWDHIFNNADIKRDYPTAKLYIHQADEHLLTKDDTGMVGKINPSRADAYLEDGMILQLGALPIKVMHTPGHSAGGVCLFFADKFLIAGDTLFKGSIGRTDLPGGSYNDIITSIRTKLLPLGDEVFVLPGHGPTSTIGYEKANNMYLIG